MHNIVCRIENCSAGGVVISTKGKNDKYRRILEAAVKVFAKNGFHESTISQIAREAGVADGTIYLYFKNKDDILVQFFNFKTRQVFAQFREEVDRAVNAVDKLRSLVSRHLSEFQQDRYMAILYHAETHRARRQAEDQIREMSKLYLDLISEIVEQGQQEGLIRKDLYVGLFKAFVFGVIITTVACHQGFMTSEGAVGVGKATRQCAIIDA